MHKKLRQSFKLPKALEEKCPKLLGHFFFSLHLFLGAFALFVEIFLNYQNIYRKIMEGLTYRFGVTPGDRQRGNPDLTRVFPIGLPF